MKMRLPAHATSFGYDGENYFPDAGGVVDIPHSALREATRHGLTLLGTAAGYVEPSAASTQMPDSARTITEMAERITELLAENAKLRADLEAAFKKRKR